MPPSRAPIALAVERAPAEYWRLAANENFMRMRMKLVPNANYDPHLDASAHRDNVRLEDLEVENKNLLEMQISKEAVGAEQSGGDDDSLTEEELKSIAKQQMETAQKGHVLTQDFKANADSSTAMDALRASQKSKPASALRAKASNLALHMTNIKIEEKKH